MKIMICSKCKNLNKTMKILSYCSPLRGAWSGDAMVLGKLLVPGRPPTNLD